MAPSPTGYLHLGHARTFWSAQERALQAGGRLLLRNEDLDRARCKPGYVSATLEDLRWFGFSWQEGPDVGGPCAPYSQSERGTFYAAALERLVRAGYAYPCTCSRAEIQRSVRAPHAGEDEPIYPGTCRHRAFSAELAGQTRGVNWRFRVPDGEAVSFADGRCGEQVFVAGRDFGDFVLWRADDVPSYQLAVVVDDAAMGITEVVRGQDLLRSTARQLLLYRALGLAAPAFYHCPLVTDAAGVRLAKRHGGLSLRALRERGESPGVLRERWREDGWQAE